LLIYKGGQKDIIPDKANLFRDNARIELLGVIPDLFVVEKGLEGDRK